MCYLILPTHQFSRFVKVNEMKRSCPKFNLTIETVEKVQGPYFRNFCPQQNQSLRSRKMPQNCGFRGFSTVSYVTCNKTEFHPTFEYGKKHALLRLRKPAQDMVLLIPSLQPRSSQSLNVALSIVRIYMWAHPCNMF